MAANDDIFAEAAQSWDLDTLYKDLSFTKGKPLTPMEKVHLRGLLCGLSPTEMAEKLGKIPKGVETDLCTTIYKYIKELLDKNEAKISNYRSICEWLMDSGYKSNPPPISSNQLLPGQSVINVVNIHIKKNEICFFINLKIPTTGVNEQLQAENLPINFDINNSDVTPF